MEPEEAPSPPNTFASSSERDLWNLIRHMPWVAALVIGSGLTWFSVAELYHSPWWSTAVCLGLPLLITLGFRRMYHDSQGAGSKAGCCCGCIPLVLFVILAPVLYRLPSHARAARCLGNINQLGLGVRMYAEDYDGMLPARAT